uniref:DUF1640 domain-containing protein n=1 Tax=Candidatus Kentrum sp. DK TaxID=2126562 RepID=A0A450SWK1_9GAMM|nr:MAG: hypothetical protein BECKDK2373C_GA0170839_10657 [Candidatus Kentron sp. DK]
MSTANTNQQPAAFPPPENHPLTLEEISGHVRAHMGEWLAEQSFAKPPAVYEVELRERMIRLEEELKHQRELMKQGFDLMEKRFGMVDKRFEMVDRRFEDMNKRFEMVDKRFDDINKRFEDVNKRFEETNRRIDRFMLWSLGAIMSASFFVIGVLKLW